LPGRLCAVAAILLLCSQRNNKLPTSILALCPPAAAFEALAHKFDFSRPHTLCDIGGSAGVLCCAVAKAHSHMSCTTFDLPAVHSAAEQYIAEQGLQGRVKVGLGAKTTAALTLLH
jgi:hypothetical protein